MSQPDKPSDVDADALLKAMARLLRERDSPSDAEESLTISDTPDEALIARITQRVIAQQQQLTVLPERRARPSHRARWIGLATAVGLALAWVMMPAQRGITPIPNYSAEISGLDGVVRGAAPSSSLPLRGTISIGNRLIVTLRPLVAYEDAVVASLWHATDTRIEALTIPLQHSAAGTVRLDAILGSELLLEPGTHRLWLLVARRSSEPQANELLAITDVIAGHDRYVLPLTLEVRAQNQ